jgi:hypothetical protein
MNICKVHYVWGKMCCVEKWELTHWPCCVLNLILKHRKNKFRYLNLQLTFKFLSASLLTPISLCQVEQVRIILLLLPPTPLHLPLILLLLPPTLRHPHPTVLHLRPTAPPARPTAPPHHPTPLPHLPTVLHLPPTHLLLLAIVLLALLCPGLFYRYSFLVHGQKLLEFWDFSLTFLNFTDYFSCGIENLFQNSIVFPRDFLVGLIMETDNLKCDNLNVNLRWPGSHQITWNVIILIWTSADQEVTSVFADLPLVQPDLSNLLSQLSQPKSVLQPGPGLSQVQPQLSQVRGVPIWC